jgi:hypothetical protein
MASSKAVDALGAYRSVTELSGEERDRPRAWVLVAAVVALCAAFFVSGLGWDQPLLEQHSFRQTQTAITAYWGIVSGWQFAYETPLFGAPWSVPFEFPLFQWLVSVVVLLTDLPLDSAGRITSFGFHVGCAAVLAVLLRQLGAGRDGAIFGGALFLLAPVNMFWGRSFLIESCALFFALAFLATVAAFLQAESRSLKYAYLVGALVLGVTGAAVKITTFVMPVAVAVGVALVTPRLPTSWREFGAALVRAAPVAAVALGALLVAVAWYRFTDSQKALNPIAQLLTSNNLSGWNFGTLQDRFSRGLWVDTIIGRAIPESVGFIGVAMIVASALFLIRGRRLALVALFVFAFIAFFLLFPRLNQVHNYYQYAAAVWLVAAAALALSVLVDRWPRTAIAAFFCVAFVQVAAFAERYLPSVVRPFSESLNRTLSLAGAVQGMTSRDGVVMALGVGWSSEIAYYAERRFIHVLDEAGPAERFFEGRNSLARPYRVETVLVCGLDRWDRLKLDRFTDAANQRMVGDCRVARLTN